MNSTATVVLTTASAVTATDNYDNVGAMIYIVIVLLWYSIGIIFMLGMQMRARSEMIEDAARRRTKLLIRTLRDQSHTKEILEELVDKQKRARLWDIYLGTTNNTKDKLTRAEDVRIRHIEKQLANLNKTRRLTNETLFAPQTELNYFRSSSDSRQIASTVASNDDPLMFRRQSSLDEQTLERWKALTNQSRVHEQIPWSVRKLMILRYFRRHPKKTLASIPQAPTPSSPVDDLTAFTQDITILTGRRNSETFNEIPNLDNRQNPYLTYFCPPSSARASILSPQFFAASSDPSIVDK